MVFPPTCRAASRIERAVPSAGPPRAAGSVLEIQAAQAELFVKASLAPPSKAAGITLGNLRERQAVCRAVTFRDGMQGARMQRLLTGRTVERRPALIRPASPVSASAGLLTAHRVTAHPASAHRALASRVRT